MQTLELMRSRHSVRQYKPTPIEADKRAALDALARQLNAKTRMNIQIIYDEPKCFDSFMAHYGKFTGVSNYIALVGKKGAKLDETLGACGAELTLKAQELGLNTCWVAMTHGKSKALVGQGEKLVCLISLGYGETQGVERSSKPLEKVSNLSADSPAWFREGVEAALYAPTAMNQQKFFFALQSDGSVKAGCKTGFYTKLDLGIVKHYFEAVTGHEVTI